MPLGKSWFIEEYNASARRFAFTSQYVSWLELLIISNCFSSFVVKRLREPKHERRPWRIWYVAVGFIPSTWLLGCFMYWENDCLHMIIYIKKKKKKRWWQWECCDSLTFWVKMKKALSTEVKYGFCRCLVIFQIKWRVWQTNPHSSQASSKCGQRKAQEDCVLFWRYCINYIR